MRSTCRPCVGFLISAVSLASLVAGCGGKGRGPRAPSAQAVFEDARPVTSPVLAWLPADTVMVLVEARVDRLAREVGWDEVARLQPEAHARAAAAVKELYGHDLLDVARLDDAGLDATRPWGVAYLDPETFVLFMPLSDPARFEETVKARAPRWSQQVAVEAVGRARVLGPQDGDAWRMVLRERTALWVLALDDAGARASAHALATAAGPGLAGHPGFARAMDELAYGRDLAGYVSGALIANPRLGLADAGLAFGIDYRREEIRMRATVPVQPGGLLARVLRAPERTPALLRALPERPLALLDAVVDGPALAELSPDGGLVTAVEIMTGLSFARDLAPLLAGEIGLAVVPAPAGAEANGSRALPVVHFLAELRDPAQGRALLERAMAQGPLAGQAQPAGEGAYRIAGPGGVVLHAGVTGRWLYASTGWSPGALPALDAGDAGDAGAFERALGKGTLALLLLGPGQAALRASVDVRVLGDWYLPEQVDTTVFDARLAELEQGYQPSEAFRQKLAEFEAARRELETLENAAVARSNQRTRDLFAALGTLALRVDPDPGRGRLVVHGALLAGPGGMPALIGEILVALTTPPGPGAVEAEALGRARERAWQLLEELAAIRRSETGEPAPGPEPEPDAGSQAPAIEGALDRQAIQRAMERARERIAACHERALARDPSLRAVDTITVELEIDAAGLVTRAEASGHAGLGQCVEEVVRSLRFPRSAPPGKTVVRYPLRF